MQVRQRSNILYHSSLYDDTVLLYDDAVETITYLERLQHYKNTVAGRYEEWRDHREVTIETIDDLQKKMDILCVGSNVAKCVGAAAGIVGLISGIAGLFLEENEDESAEDFKQFGKYCSEAGVAVAASSTLLEAGLTQAAINKIKQVVIKDEELTNPLRNWLQTSRKVDQSLNRLFECDIVSNTFTNTIKVSRHCLQLLGNGEAELKDLIFSLSRCKMEGFEDISFEVFQKVCHFLKRIQSDPRLLQPLKEICNIFQETPYTFDFVKLGVRLYNNTCEILQGTPLKMVLSAAGLSSTFSLSSTLMGRCALDTIAIGSEIVTIILAIQNIKEGKSKYSESLDHLKFALRMELTEINSKMNQSVGRSHLYYQDRHQICY